MLINLARLPAQLAGRPKHIALFAVSILFLVLWFLSSDIDGDWPIRSGGRSHLGIDIHHVASTVQQYRQSPIRPPYKYQFWEVGQRCKKLVEWLHYVDLTHDGSRGKEAVLSAVETAARDLFPFIAPSPRSPHSTTPLGDLRRVPEKGTRGIVIPVGGSGQSVRFAGHLIASLREVLGCRLPIQITYAGEDDLTRQQRDVLSALDSTNNIDFVDVLSVFNDSHAGLRNGHWAIKPFAALASRFEEVIVIDADAVFLQLPEKLFAQGPYRRTGAYLFHDRLLWQHAFRERHDWWKDQIKEPSAALNNSRVWIEDYAEECDSGVAVLDKSRAEVFIGLLHIAWQNTHGVREEVSYRLTYGDKETWWLGLELVGAGYEFEQHYGSIVGWERDTQDDDNGAGGGGVCSFVIAHTDEDERLLWFNGSLLKNKLADPESYKVPTAWMTDGVWQKGATKESMSCMVGAEVRKLTGEEQRILQRSIEGARRVDSILKENGTSLSLHQ